MRTCVDFKNHLYDYVYIYPKSNSFVQNNTTLKLNLKKIKIGVYFYLHFGIVCACDYNILSTFINEYIFKCNKIMYTMIII